MDRSPEGGQVCCGLCHNQAAGHGLQERLATRYTTLL